MQHKRILFYCFVILSPFIRAQNNTFSPYSRYALGDMAAITPAHNQGMGGAFIALKPDSTMPNFINTGNPAAYSLIKLTTLEVGGSFFYSQFKGQTTSLRKWSTNFTYGTLGFPIGQNGGACFGLTPYSNVGYDMQNVQALEGVGDVRYQYRGSGGLNKAFLGYGVMPFRNRLIKFNRRHLYAPDSMKHLSRGGFKVRQFFSKILSDLSIGANANYVFGRIDNETNINYPNNLLYRNTYVGHFTSVSSLSGNFGMQSAITFDSVSNAKNRRKRIDAAVEALKTQGLAGQELEAKRDSLERNMGYRRRALSERVKITFGYFMALNNNLSADRSTLSYNYSLDGTGAFTVPDTLIYSANIPGKIKLPLEQGFGLGFKKGDRLNVVADFAITNWQEFKFFDETNDFKASYRIALGMNYVPEKYAAGRGTFFRRVNYRLGGNYQSGYLNIRNTTVSDMSVSAGVGIPVGIGRLSSMVNISGQYGQMGTTDNGLLKQTYWRVNFGFTFSDRWFQKFRYD